MNASILKRVKQVGVLVMYVQSLIILRFVPGAEGFAVFLGHC